MSITDSSKDPFDGVRGVPELILVENGGPCKTHDLKITLEQKIQENKEILGSIGGQYGCAVGGCS